MQIKMLNSFDWADLVKGEVLEVLIHAKLDDKDFVLIDREAGAMPLDRFEIIYHKPGFHEIDLSSYCWVRMDDYQAEWFIPDSNEEAIGLLKKIETI